MFSPEGVEGGGYVKLVLSEEGKEGKDGFEDVLLREGLLKDGVAAFGEDVGDGVREFVSRVFLSSGRGLLRCLGCECCGEDTSIDDRVRSPPFLPSVTHLGLHKERDTKDKSNILTHNTHRLRIFIKHNSQRSILRRIRIDGLHQYR